MEYKATSKSGWIAWTVLASSVIAIAVYLIYGSPEHLVNRIQFVIITLAIISIPFGIKYGTQDKFWT